MFVDIGDTGSRLSLQPTDIPELSRVCMGVENIIDAERGAPARRQRVIHVEVHLPEALAVDLGKRGFGRGVGA